MDGPPQGGPKKTEGSSNLLLVIQGFNYHKVVVKVSLSLSFFSTGVFAEMTANVSEFSDLSLDQY